MSIWTHVVGSISGDVFGSLFDDKETPAETAERVTGKWYQEWRNREMWPNALEDIDGYGDGPDMPSGSEGPLMFVANNLGSKNSANNLLVSFWGNLRDFGTPEVEQDLLPWFKDLLSRYKQFGIGVRNMAIQVQVEYGPVYLLSSKDGELHISKFDDWGSV